MLPICQTIKAAPKVMSFVELQIPGSIAVHGAVLTRVQDYIFTLNLGFICEV
jgi:hypothetical protein